MRKVENKSETSKRFRFFSYPNSFSLNCGLIAIKKLILRAIFFNKSFHYKAPNIQKHFSHVLKIPKT